MKKLLLLFLACILCVSLIACDSQSSVTVPKNDTNTTPSTNTNPSGDAPSTTPADNNTWLNVATYNILHCADLTDPETQETGGDGLAFPDKYVQLIQDYEIDIIGMNEVDVNCQRSMGAYKSEYRNEYKCNQPKYIAEKLTEQTGEQYYWAFAASITNHSRIEAAFAGDALYGNAIISRYPIVSTRNFKVYTHNYDPTKPETQFGPSLGSGNQYEVKTVLIAEIDVDGTIVTVISAHYGLAEDERARMTQMLLAEVENIETPVILMGDFNSLPTDTNILQLNEVLNPAGGVDNVTTTFPAKKNHRIDYIYTSSSLEMKNYDVLYKLKYSDHYCVTVKVGLPQAEAE